MGIVELIQNLGDENISLQMLDRSITHAQAKQNGDVLVTFGCQVPIADLGMLGPPKKRGMILWVTTEKLDAALKQPLASTTQTLYDATPLVEAIIDKLCGRKGFDEAFDVDDDILDEIKSEMATTIATFLKSPKS
jgi:hypothetical protein